MSHIQLLQRSNGQLTIGRVPSQTVLPQSIRGQAAPSAAARGGHVLKEEDFHSPAAKMLKANDPKAFAIMRVSQRIARELCKPYPSSSKVRGLIDDLPKDALGNKTPVIAFPSERRNKVAYLARLKQGADKLDARKVTLDVMTIARASGITDAEIETEVAAQTGMRIGREYAMRAAKGQVSQPTIDAAMDALDTDPLFDSNNKSIPPALMGMLYEGGVNWTKLKDSDKLAMFRGLIAGLHDGTTRSDSSRLQSWKQPLEAALKSLADTAGTGASAPSSTRSANVPPDAGGKRPELFSRPHPDLAGVALFVRKADAPRNPTSLPQTQDRDADAARLQLFEELTRSDARPDRVKRLLDKMPKDNAGKPVFRIPPAKDATTADVNYSFIRANVNRLAHKHGIAMSLQGVDDKYGLATAEEQRLLHIEYGAQKAGAEYAALFAHGRNNRQRDKVGRDIPISILSLRGTLDDTIAKRKNRNNFIESLTRRGFPVDMDPAARKAALRGYLTGIRSYISSTNNKHVTPWTQAVDDALKAIEPPAQQVPAAATRPSTASPQIPAPPADLPPPLPRPQTRVGVSQLPRVQAAPLLDNILATPNANAAPPSYDDALADGIKDAAHHGRLAALNFVFDPSTTELLDEVARQSLDGNAPLTEKLQLMLTTCTTDDGKRTLKQSVEYQYSFLQGFLEGLAERATGEDHGRVNALLRKLTHGA